MTPHERFKQRWDELRRQPAFQAALVFLAGGWLLLQAADVFGLPTTAVRALGAFVLVVFIGLGAFAWVGSSRALASGRTAAARMGTRARVLLATAATLLVLSVTFWAVRPRLFGGSVAAGAELIAVLPFSTSGASVEVLGEGLVDLLSANLNEAAGIRTINPRTALHRWRRATAGGATDLQGQLQVGRALGAGSILTGSAVAVGGEVRITAELLGVSDGDRLAHAAVSGSADSVLALVDAISIALLRDIWRTREALPELSVAGITTHSLPAVRAFLQGEQYFRRSAFDSAGAAYERALAHDSTFALAYFRLAETYGWREALGSSEAQLAAANAVRFADRLPTRERRLVHAHQLHELGDPAAIDSLRVYTQTFPDDATGWYFLGDALYHAGSIRAITPADILTAFDSAIARDSTLAHTYAHPLEVAVQENDTVRFDGYLQRYHTVVPDDTFYVVLRRLRTDTSMTTDEILPVFGRWARSRPAAGSFMMSLARANLLNRPEPRFDRFFALLEGIEGQIGVQPEFAVMRIGHGRFEDAEPAIEELRRLGGTGAALNVQVAGLLQRIAPTRWTEEIDSLMNSVAAGSTMQAYWRTIAALEVGDTATAKRFLAAAAEDTIPERTGLFLGAEGLLSLERGDTAKAVRQLHTALDSTGYAPIYGVATLPLRFRIALLEVTQPELRTDGLKRLAMIEAREMGVLGGLYYEVGRSLEAAGEDELAAEYYARFVTLWDGADADVQVYVENARNALKRLRQS